MITVSGKTYENRELLKSIQGKRWNADAKAWEFDYISSSDLERVRNTVGLIVTEGDEVPPPMSVPDDDDNVDAIIAALFSPDRYEKPINGTRQTAIYGDDPRYFNYFKDQNPLAFFGFSSLDKMADYVAAIPSNKHANGHRLGTWHGTPDMAAALALARDGWPEGVENAQEVLELLTVPHAVERKREYNVTGGQVSVGRMLAGDPAHMVRRPKLPGRKMITLFAETTASAVIKIDNMIARAAIIAAIADILEREGYSCEIIALEINTDQRKPGAQTAVTVKHAGEKLNLNNAVFALGHPSFLRRLQFACVCSSDECRPIWDTQGIPSFAFSNDHPTKSNEFYIRPLLREQQNDIIGTTLRTRALSMLEFVKPLNLPIEIKGEW